MLTEKQIAERLTGIGSSDSSAVLGVNPYRSADDVLQEKLGLKPPFEGNEATYWGDFMEPHLRKEYEKRTGLKVRYSKKMCRHPEDRHIIAHLDGVICGSLYGAAHPGVLEIKTIRYPPKDWTQHYHWVQIQHAMWTVGASWGCLAVLVGGNDFQMIEVRRDDEFIQAMRTVYADFWQTVLNARKERAA